MNSARHALPGAGVRLNLRLPNPLPALRSSTWHAEKLADALEQVPAARLAELGAMYVECFDKDEEADDRLLAWLRPVFIELLRDVKSNGTSKRARAAHTLHDVYYDVQKMAQLRAAIEQVRAHLAAAAGPRLGFTLPPLQPMPGFVCPKRASIWQFLEYVSRDELQALLGIVDAASDADEDQADTMLIEWMYHIYVNPVYDGIVNWGSIQAAIERAGALRRAARLLAGPVEEVVMEVVDDNAQMVA